jgi:hypothetical protein
VDLNDGRTLIVPIGLIPGLAEAPARALGVCELSPAGISVYFPALDEHVGVENLLQPELATTPKVLPRGINPGAIATRGSRRRKAR